MTISLTKQGAFTVLACTRRDGSVTWQKSSHGGFFGQHDLLHYAIETTLGLRESFFGLVAMGRSIESFTEPGTAASLPLEALHTELMVNQLMIETNYEGPSTAEVFNKTMADSCAASKGGSIAPPRAISDAQLDLIRERFGKLMSEWSTLNDGEKLELPFPVN